MFVHTLAYKVWVVLMTKSYLLRLKLQGQNEGDKRCLKHRHRYDRSRNRFQRLSPLMALLKLCNS